MITLKLAQRCLFISTALLAAFPAWAGSESEHVLSVSGGIASPSMDSALGENPAGLIYNNKLRLLGALAADNSSLNPLGFQGTLLSGNGSVGGALGLRTYDGRSTGSFGSTTFLDFGLSAYSSSMNVSLGVDGSYRLRNTAGGGGKDLGVDLGFIYNPNGPFRVGGTVFQVADGVSAIAAGIASEFNKSATFALDASIDKNGNGLTVKPGLGIQVSPLYLSYSYGIRVDKNAASWLRTESSLGVGLEASPKIDIQFYYNEIAQYYLGATISL